MEAKSDNAVMTLLQEGDTAQLAILFERHHLALFRYLRHLTRNRALSEDLTQDVFFRILKYASTFDSSQSFTAWMYQMARNTAFDSMRKRRPEADPETIGEFRSHEPMPEELFSRKQDVLFLRRALHALPDDKRDVLVLSRFQNLKYDEIATLLNCETGAIKVRVYRALKQLRENFCELRGEKVI